MPHDFRRGLRSDRSPLHDVRQHAPAGGRMTDGGRENQNLCGREAPTGGARRDRTDDLLLAKQALSQLSYGPVRSQASATRNQEPVLTPDTRLLVPGFGGPGTTR